MAGRRTESETIISSECDADISNHESLNVTAAVNLTIKLKALYGLFNRLKISILEALYHLLNSDEALGFFEAFHELLTFLVSFLGALIGLHFQALGKSPLDSHFAIILLLFMAIIVYGIAYVEMKLQPLDADLPIFRFICLVSGIITIELLVTIIISPFWRCS